MKKVCLVTCYNQPDYIRAKTLRTAFGRLNGVQLIVVKNTNKGWWRYFEVFWKLIVVRITKRPDLYFLTFRGYEMLPLTRIVTVGKPLVFDEFINLVEWLVYEHKKLKAGGILANILQDSYRFWLNTVDLITTDTKSHAAYSSKLMNVPISKYVPLIVSTDEHIFGGPIKRNRQDDTFRVFYYGTMLPLHGLDVVIDALRLLKGRDIELTLIGGKKNTQDMAGRAQSDGLPIVYQKWVPFNNLPMYIRQSDVCLGGPFGGTVQSNYVITGKTYQFLQMGCSVIVGKNQESQIFTDKKDALLVEQSNAQSLADTILWASQHRQELSDIGRNGKKLYEKEFSNKKLVEQLKLLLERIF